MRFSDAYRLKKKLAGEVVDEKAFDSAAELAVGEEVGEDITDALLFGGALLAGLPCGTQTLDTNWSPLAVNAGQLIYADGSWWFVLYADVAKHVESVLGKKTWRVKVNPTAWCNETPGIVPSMGGYVHPETGCFCQAGPIPTDWDWKTRWQHVPLSLETKTDRVADRIIRYARTKEWFSGVGSTTWDNSGDPQGTVRDGQPIVLVSLRPGYAELAIHGVPYVREDGVLVPVIPDKINIPGVQIMFEERELAIPLTSDEQGMGDVGTALGLPATTDTKPCASLPSGEAAHDLVSGDLTALPRVLTHTALRAALIGTGMWVMGASKKTLVRNALAGSVGIDLFVLLWATIRKRETG
jgi:hypothetical protein